MRTVLFVASLAFLLSACAGPILQQPYVSAPDVQLARHTLATHRVHPSLDPVTVGEMQRILERGWARTQPAVFRVCTQVLTHCGEVMRIRVILVGSSSVNAYADGRSMTIGVHQGFIRAMGSDEELIAVLGHEAAHLLLGHTESKARNSTVGALTGLLAGIAAGVALQQPGADQAANQQIIQDMSQLGITAGAYVGAVVYSPEMEIEADQFAVHVLADLGIRLNAGMDMIVRLVRGYVPGAVKQGEGWAGFLSTHPPHDYRLAAMQATIRDLRSGGRLRRPD